MFIVDKNGFEVFRTAIAFVMKSPANAYDFINKNIQED